jgi:hypothetical protein
VQSANDASVAKCRSTWRSNHTFNPLRERELERFTNPKSPVQMLTGSSTAISTQYHQLKAGGDIAAIMGICKALIEEDDKSRVNGHVHGFDDFAAAARNYSWEQLERQSGLRRAAIEGAATIYARAERVIAIYGMDLSTTSGRRGSGSDAHSRQLHRDTHASQRHRKARLSRRSKRGRCQSLSKNG